MPFDIVSLIGRILFGGYFLVNAFMHFTKTEGYAQYAASKKVPMPKAAVLISGAMLFVGGIGMFWNILLPWAVGSLVIFLAVAAFKMHDFWTVQDPMQKMTQMTFFSRNLALIGAALMMLQIR